MAGNGTCEQEFTESDLEDLKAAKTILENPSLTAQISDVIGAPIEKVLEHVPEKLRNKIEDITHQALLQGLNIAVASLGETEQRSSKDRLHKVLAVGTGVTGGLFGFTALAVELPATTGVILRSIADIAQSQGHDLTRLEVRLACLEVFALGGTTAKDDAVEGGYWVARAAMAQQLRQAAHDPAYVRERWGSPGRLRLRGRLAEEPRLVPQPALPPAGGGGDRRGVVRGRGRGGPRRGARAAVGAGGGLESSSRQLPRDVGPSDPTDHAGTARSLRGSPPTSIK